MKVETVWQGKMKFTSRNEAGHRIEMDAATNVGGEDSAQRPKELLLDALAGCTAMDVISILRKMKAEPESLRIEVDADVAQTHPLVFTHIRLAYFVKGDVPEEKLQKAIKLSQENYCVVSAMLRKACDISYSTHFE